MNTSEKTCIRCVSTQRMHPSGLAARNLPSPLLVLTSILSFAILATFALLALHYGPTAPMLFLVMPVPGSLALILLTLERDHEARAAARAERPLEEEEISDAEDD